MKLGDFASRIVIERRKLTEYALNPDNPKGAKKAVMFQRHLGFTQDNYKLLLQQITEQAINAEAVLGRNDEHGQRYQVDLEIIGVAEGQREIVRTGWIVKPDSDAAFVSNALCAEAIMTEPELFDLIELLVDLPEDNLSAGVQGAIVECYDDSHYEVEFTNQDGETLALCTLSPKQFIVVWKAKNRIWLSVS